jgi:TolB-like protein
VKPTVLRRIWVMVVCGVILMPLAAAAAPAKIVILPFTVHADKDYSFLQRGIVEMLTSRLSAPDKVVVVDPVSTQKAVEGFHGAGGEDLARQVGAALKADYVVQGSVTVLGESVSIDAATVVINGGRPPLSFFKQTQNLGGVIPQINQMAEEINTELLGLPPRATSAQNAAPTAPPAPAQTAPPAPADIYTHPDKLLQNSPFLSSGTVTPASPAPARANPLNPAFEAAPGMQSGNSATFWKSQNYDYMINGIDVGDVDHDGLMETVVAAPDRIMIYRFSRDRQQTVADIVTSRYARNISVSVGDINGNGTPEIFVTAFNLNLDMVESFVLEYDGHQFKRIVDKSRYYYSVVHHPTLGALLLGQRQGSGATPLDAPIFQMVWKGADYVPDHQILPARKANVLGLAYGNIMNNGDDSFAAYNPHDHLQVILPGGKVEWKDEKTYGGTVLYFTLPSASMGSSGHPFYLPVRLRCADLDRNGKYEVLAFRNEGGTGRQLSVQRYFSRSHIEALQWDGLGLTTLWKTRDLAGRMQDFTVADFDNDGVQELLAAVVSKEGAIIFSDAQSSLIAFKLKQTR